MIGGLLKSASRLALVAAAGVIVGGVSAQAADLGGDCCADLEERVADLEATTVRKGNRKVSLQISGQVNHALMYYNDGSKSDTYVVDNEFSSTRFRFLGSAKIDSKWSAGYYLEWEVFNAARSDLVNQNANFAGPQAGDDGQALNTNLSLRHSAWWIQNADYGQLWVGHTSTASDGVTYINLSQSNLVAFSKSQLVGNGLFLRRAGVAGSAGLSGLTWGNVRPQGNGGDISVGRHDLIKYVSPTLAGFVFSASWGEDDVWDVALRYAGEFSGVKIAAGVAYAQINDGGQSNAGNNSEFGCADASSNNVAADVDCSQVSAGISAMHVPTGLFVTASYGERDDKKRDALYGFNVDNKDTAWQVQVGIEQKWFSIGKSTIVGHYGETSQGAGLNNGGVRTLGSGNLQDPLADGLGFGVAAATRARIQGAEITSWGVGFVQNIEAAAMDLYMGYTVHSADVTLMNATGGNVRKSNSVDDVSLFMAGGIIRF